MPLLAVEHLSKSFGAIKVADDLTFSLHCGEALGVIGPNGAGKSSLFNMISGNIRPSHGQIYFEEKNITKFSPQQRCRAGIGRTYQIPQPFLKMTVFENVLVSASFGRNPHERQTYDACVNILERTGLLRKTNTLAGTLTLLERKRLELARALASSPGLLLLDEIAAGLTEHEAGELIATIKQIHSAGTAIVWIEHVMHALIAVVGRLLVMNFGTKVTDGEPASVLSNPEVRRIYMGIEVE
jgi:branched-chain amino acid transport system ATP-binding protein